MRRFHVRFQVQPKSKGTRTGQAAIATRLVAATLMGLAPVMILTGCDDPKEVSAKNFGKVIQDGLKKQGEVCLERLRWPVQVNLGASSEAFNAQATSDASRMAALEAHGLVSSTIEESTDFLKQKSRTQIYRLTDAGSKYLLERDIPNFLGDGSTKRTDFCWARMQLADIVKWMGPGQSGAYPVVSVKYTYQLANVPEWAQSPNITKAFPEIQQRLAGQKQEEMAATLRLSNLGWEMAR